MSGSMLSDAEVTILSLVAEGPRYGSEIEEVIAKRGLREWLIVGSVSFYYILDRLEQQTLITRRLDPVLPGPAHTVFQITDAGRGVVQTAVSDLLRQPRSLADSFAIGLANIGALKPQQAYRALLQHHEMLTHRLQMAETLWARHQEAVQAAQESHSEGVQALYTHGIAVMQAELDWLNGFIEEWRVRHPAVAREETSEIDTSATTPLHHPTLKADEGKQLQKIKRPKAE